MKIYVSPVDGSPLSRTTNGYTDQHGNHYPETNGIPNFIYPKELPASDLFSLEWYRKNAEVYDTYLPLTFKTFRASEDEERKKLVDALQVQSQHKVLEIGAGSGRDSVIIASEYRVFSN